MISIHLYVLTKRLHLDNYKGTCKVKVKMIKMLIKMGLRPKRSR